MKFGVFDHMDRGQSPLDRLYEERLTLAEEYDLTRLFSRLYPCNIVIINAISDHGERTLVAQHRSQTLRCVVGHSNNVIG